MTQVITETIVGIKGSGKSYFAGYQIEQEVLRNNIDFVVLDIKGIDHVHLAMLPRARLFRLTPSASPDWDALIRRHKRLVIANDGCTFPTFVHHTSRICEVLMSIGERMVVFEEAQNIAPKYGILDPNFQNVVCTGRNLGLDVICVSQRPALLSSTAISESNHIFIFYLMGKNDLDWIRPFVPASVVEQTPSLQFQEAWHVEVGGNVERVKAGMRYTKHGG